MALFVDGRMLQVIWVLRVQVQRSRIVTFVIWEEGTNTEVWGTILNAIDVVGHFFIYWHRRFQVEWCGLLRVWVAVRMWIKAGFRLVE